VSQTLSKAIKAPRRTLNRLSSRASLANLRSRQKSDSSLGSPMSLTLSSLSARSPAENIANFYPPVEDEVIVNNALILFLEALSDMVPNGKSEWTPRHVSFRSSFATAKFEARTDGCLQSLNWKKVQAIVEVKPRVRGANPMTIEMQEAAQMVGWIFNDADPIPILNGQ
jgi:hypothetical protein